MTKLEKNVGQMKTAPLQRLLLLLLLCLMAGGARAEDPPRAAPRPLPSVSTPARASYTFPFTSLFYGAPVVQARINDTVTTTFLIDTGASTNAISQTLVDRLGLKPQTTNQIAVPSLLQGKQVPFVSLQKVLIGSLTLQGGAYIVLPATTLSAGMRQEVDGIIGMGMLRYFAIDLDFSRHRMTLWYPNGLDDDAVRQAGFSDAFMVALIPSISDAILYDRVKVAESVEAYWSLTYSVPVKIGDGIHTSQQNLLLDMGSGVTIFPSDVSKSLNLKVQETSTLPNITTGLQQASVVQASSLQVGGLRLVDHTVGILRAKTAGEVTTNGPTPLGLDVLSGYRILIDFGAKKMYFKTAIPQIRVGAPQGKKP